MAFQHNAFQHNAFQTGTNAAAAGPSSPVGADYTENPPKGQPYRTVYSVASRVSLALLAAATVYPSTFCFSTAPNPGVRPVSPAVHQASRGSPQTLLGVNLPQVQEVFANPIGKLPSPAVYRAQDGGFRLLVGAIPIGQETTPNPRGNPPPRHEAVQGVNLSLQTSAPVYPSTFMFGTFPNPPGAAYPSTNRGSTLGASAGFIPPTPPKVQSHDRANPRGPQETFARGWQQDTPQSFFPGNAPFAQTDWPNPRGYKPTFVFGSTQATPAVYTLATVYPATFVYTTAPNPAKPVQQMVGQVVNPVVLVPTGTPFSETDWQNPRGPKPTFINGWQQGTPQVTTLATVYPSTFVIGTFPNPILRKAGIVVDPQNLIVLAQENVPPTTYMADLQPKSSFVGVNSAYWAKGLFLGLSVVTYPDTFVFQTFPVPKGPQGAQQPVIQGQNLALNVAPSAPPFVYGAFPVPPGPRPIQQPVAQQGVLNLSLNVAPGAPNVASHTTNPRGPLYPVSLLTQVGRLTPDQIPPAPPEVFPTFGGGSKWYIIKGRKYKLTNEELTYLLAREAVDLTREDIKVSYKNQKPHKISAAAYVDLMAAVGSLEAKLIEMRDDDDDDEDAITALLL